MDVNFELYKVFYHVVKEGQISAAAKKLFISQPAVSQSIKQLETKLGGSIFFRTPKGMKLTAEGEILYEFIEKAYGFIMTAEAKFKEVQNLEAGEIVIGASDTLCAFYLLPYLEQFHSKYPQIKIKVTNRTTYEIINLLRNGNVDLGIINLPIKDDKHLNIKETVTLQDCFIYGERYKGQFDGPISVEALAEHPLLLLEEGSNTRAFVDQFFESKNVHIEPEIELGSVDLLLKFAKIGLGIACVTKNFIREELEREGIYEVHLKDAIPVRKIGVATLKGVPVAPAAKEFLSLLLE